ncbi:MAG TPA: hypothetical protein VJZ91_19090 [Blastocatellia bacterium]|nr:hypothetical protein [Blastocatellia bacterium]
MKSKGLLFMAAFIICAFSAAARAQDGQEYVDKSGGYKLSLFGDWRAVNYNDAVGRAKTEFVFRDRSEGLLKISSQRLEGSVANMAQAEEENQRIYRAGFERAASETFGGGSLSGVRLSFYTAEGTRQLAHTIYFLQDKSTVYVLRFSGKRGVLDRNRNLSDQVARSFQPLNKE